MSIPPPQFLHSHVQQLSTDIYDKPDINIWIIIVTGVIFFIVLSWYDAISSLFLYNFGNGNASTTIDVVRANMLYAVFWTIFAIIVYIVLERKGKLSSKKSYTERHPPAKDNIYERLDRVMPEI